MRCIICGKKLVGKQRKYCCMEHAQVGYKIGRAETYKDNSHNVRELFQRFKKSFNCGDNFFCNKGKFIRIFVSACLQSGWDVMSISRGIGKHHSTIYEHRDKIIKSEERIAKDFLENKNYVYGSKYNNFTYGVKK